MTGIGRTGKMFGMDHWGVQPDIMALGKGMSAGYTAIAAALVSEKVMKPIVKGSGSIMSGHTYSANPQSASVSLAVLHYIEKHHLIDKVKEKGEYLIEKLQDLAKDMKMIGDVRGLGLMIGVEFVADKKSKQPFQPTEDVTSRVIEKARDKGLLIYPASAGNEGVSGDAVIISPPFTITKQEIDDLVDIFEETILEIQFENC
jgi:adenosylmethionine-8-amino-7-oxononanoate aminotransferase